MRRRQDWKPLPILKEGDVFRIAIVTRGQTLWLRDYLNHGPDWTPNRTEALELPDRRRVASIMEALENWIGRVDEPVVTWGPSYREDL